MGTRSLSRPPGATVPSTVPTVAKLPRPRRCSATAQIERRGTRRCPLYSDTALDDQVLCPLHLGEAPWIPEPPPAGDTEIDAPRRPAAEEQRRCDLLRDVLEHLHDGIPDPTTDGQQLLVILPAALADRIEDVLTCPCG